MLVLVPDLVSAHLILGNLGCALVQLAGLESQKKRRSQFAHFADLAEIVAACLVCCSFSGHIFDYKRVQHA